MTRQRWAAIDGYITDLLVPPDPALDAALEAAAAAGLPPHDVAPNQGKLLHLLALMLRARTILEIGTLGGYSTIWLAGGLADGGRLITLEADPTYAEIASANIARAGLADVVELRVGRALDTLPQLAAEGRGPFDLIFIDADKASNAEYLGWSLELSRRGTLIVADNVVRRGAVADAASADENVRAVRELNARLARTPGATATVVQTVSAKGYDGFAISVVGRTKE